MTFSEAGRGLAGRYAAVVRGRVLTLSALCLLLIAAVILDIAAGASQSLPLGALLRGMVDPPSLSEVQALILWQVRLPFALGALVVGACLGLAGAEVQTVLNNPLASPYTLGLSSAATLGAAIAIVFDLRLPGIAVVYTIPISAFAFAMLASGIVLLLARTVGGGLQSIILFGIAIVFASNALVALTQYIAESNALEEVVFWTMGSLSRTTWEKLAVILAFLLVVAPFSWRSCWKLTTLRSGEDQARSLGIDTRRVRRGALIRAAALSAVAVAFAGAIGFIGLISPHIARMLLGEDHRFYLPGSLVVGALVLTLASIISKQILPGVILPVGIVTAVVGVPLFVGLILLQRRRP